MLKLNASRSTSASRLMTAWNRGVSIPMLPSPSYTPKHWEHQDRGLSECVGFGLMGQRPRGSLQFHFPRKTVDAAPAGGSNTPAECQQCRYCQHCQQWDAALVPLMGVRERIVGPPRRRPRTSSIPAGELTPTRGGDWVMTKGHRPPHSRRPGLDGKQKAQIAVAVVTTLPQLIWAIAFLLSALIGR